MRRSLLPLVLVVVVAAACKGGGTGTSPTFVQPTFWVGDVVFSTKQVEAGLQSTYVVKGSVDWVKEEGEELAPLGTSYKIQSGFLTVTLTSESVASCRVSGGTTLTLRSGDGSLLLGPNGTYTGQIRAQKPFSATLSCSGGEVSLGSLAFVNLQMRGQVDNLRMEGTMEPLVAGGVTSSGSWDFLAR